MLEFIKLYLSGARADALNRYQNKRNRAFLVEALGTALCVILAFAVKDKTALLVCMSILLVAVLVASGFILYLSLKSRRAAFGLMKEEQLSDPQKNEREVYKTYYEKFMQVFSPKTGILGILACFFEPVSCSFSAVWGLLCALGIPAGDGQFYFAIVYLAALLLTLFGTVVRAAVGQREVRTFNDAAQAEIEVLKAESGTAFLGKNTATAPQDYFLKRFSDRSEFQKITAIHLLVFVFWVICMVALGLVAACVSREDNAALVFGICGSLAALLVVVWIVALVLLERWKRKLYAHNEGTLSDSEGDGIRRRLQGAFQRFSRVGNAVFAIAVSGAILAGLACGIIQVVQDGGADAATTIGGSLVIWLVVVCVIAIIVYSVLFTRYRKSVKPLEEQLKQIESSRKEEYDGQR